MKNKKRSFTPKLLKLWTTPDNYAGSQYPDYYRTGFGQSRDSDLMERCNFSAALTALGGETKQGVIVIRSSHWACGWVEAILVHKNATAKLRIADELAKRIAEYCILDEDSFFELEREEQEETLKNYSADFMKELESALGRTLQTQDEVAESVDLIAAVFFEDCGYCGPEDAWVSAKSLKRYLLSYEGQHDGKPIATELRIKLDAYPKEVELAV